MSSPMPPRVLCESTRTLCVSQADSLLLRSCGNELLHVHGRSERGSRSYSLWGLLPCFPFVPSALKILGLKPSGD